MKVSFNFDIGEININKKEADELREYILLSAKNKNIGTNPIQYELLLKNIKSKMIELSSEIDFSFNGSSVDFNNENPVIFTTRVLKSIFSEKKESEVITIQTKNLDILSFYANNKPWTKNIVATEDVKKQKTDTEPNNILKSIKKRWKIKHSNILILLGFLICMIIITYLLKLLMNENDKHSKSEKEYQSVINKLYNPEYFEKYEFDEINYDTLKIPPKPIIFTANFDDVNVVFKNDGGFQSQGVNCKPEFNSVIFDEQPGIKSCNSFKGEAFGFGKTYCDYTCNLRNSSYYRDESHLCILRISFNRSTFVSYISFDWVEVDGNWGSTGNVHINGDTSAIGVFPYQTIGIYPNSNKLLDEEIRKYKCRIDTLVKFIDIAIWDISYESEIFISNIEIRGK